MVVELFHTTYSDSTLSAKTSLHLNTDRKDKSYICCVSDNYVFHVLLIEHIYSSCCGK